MTTRFLAPLGLLSATLGILALVADARGYPFLLIGVGGILVALSFIRPGACSSGSPAAPAGDPAGFSMPPVGTCPPERLREARVLAARVIEASDARADGRHQGS
jgi:hypothetical protein